MTKSALWNLQHGVPEDRRFEHTTYNPESEIDRLVLARIDMRNRYKLLIDQKNQEEYENQVATNIAKKIEKLLTDSFK